MKRKSDPIMEAMRANLVEEALETMTEDQATTLVARNAPSVDELVAIDRKRQQAGNDALLADILDLEGISVQSKLYKACLETTFRSMRSNGTRIPGPIKDGEGLTGKRVGLLEEYLGDPNDAVVAKRLTAYKKFRRDCAENLGNCGLKDAVALGRALCKGDHEVTNHSSNKDSKRSEATPTRHSFYLKETKRGGTVSKAAHQRLQAKYDNLLKRRKATARKK